MQAAWCACGMAVLMLEVFETPNEPLLIDVLAQAAAQAHCDTPQAEALVKAALGFVAAWPARQARRGAPEWAAAQIEARAVLVKFFFERTALAVEKLGVTNDAA
jgi:hypothetical protein